ncbi:hypothetical protein [Lysinibacillus boronitolerans]|uniref:hypothetical protein n=1 Tax=Lysinibacillus boronitolerans TaxID=309788 RepID=UPI00289C475D|nr:hypothetical protein [Lysinibacillus boronitolerans]
MLNYTESVEIQLENLRKQLDALKDETIKANEKMIQIISVPVAFEKNGAHRIIALALTSRGNLWGIAINSFGDWYTVER